MFCMRYGGGRYRKRSRSIEWICQHTVVGFNLAFDWFHISKIYTIFRLCDPDWIPEEHIDEIAMLEPQGQQGPCVKPASALDLMLHSRKGPFQSLMARDDIRIKRVPTALAYALADELEHRIHLDNIYFAKSADAEAPRWQVFDRKDKWGDIDTDFKDVVLRFNPAGGLKFLAEHALGYKPKFHFRDVEPPSSWRPYELGYAPTALAVSSPEKGWAIETDEDSQRVTKYAWPGVIRKHIEHWATRADAREYANDDIVYTRALDKHFGCPEPGDDDSTLACMVPVVRWRGFQIDRPGIEELLCKAQRDRGHQPGEHQQAGRRAGLRHGRNGRHGGRGPRREHQEVEPGGRPGLGDRGGRAVRQVPGRPELPPLRRHGPVEARQTSRGRSRQDRLERQVRRQGGGTLRKAAGGRQVPRQLRGHWGVVVPHGRRGRLESRRGSNTPRKCGGCSRWPGTAWSSAAATSTPSR